MANILAAQAGNWSATATWTGGVLPGSNDVAVANGKTVTIDQDIAVVALDSTTTGGASNGGTFAISSVTGTRTITLSEGLGTVTATGRVSNSPPLTISATSGTVVISTALAGGGPSGGNSWAACRITGTCNVILTGSAQGVFAGSAGGAGAFSIQGAATLTIQGDVRGMNGSSAVEISSNSVLDVWGTVSAASNAAGITGFTPSSIRVRTLVDAPNGRKAVWAPSWLMQSGQLCTETIMDDQIAAPFTPGSQVILANYVTASPAPANVRAGVVYGPSGTLTGTMAVPTAAQVGAGVPVDGTTGTAALILADVAAVTGAQIASAVGA